MYRRSRIKPSHNPRFFILMVPLAVSPNFPLDKYTMTGGDSGPEILSNVLWKKLDLGSTWGLMS